MRTVASFVTMAILMAALLPTASAQELSDPNPALPEWVETTLVIEQQDLTTLDIVGTIIIRKFVIEDTPYRTADDMADAYQQFVQADEFARQNGQESSRADQFVADLENNTRNALLDTLESNFAGAEVTVGEARLDRRTLESPSGNAYDPGVLLEISAQVVRTADDAGVGELDIEAVKVAFDSGARITAPITLSAGSGHDITYVLFPPQAPEGLAFISAENATLDGDAVVARIDNSAGAAPKEVTITTRLANPDARTYTEEQIEQGARISATVDLKDLDITLGGAAAGDMGNLIGEVIVRAEMGVIEIPPELKSALPSNVELDVLTSNAIRLLYQHDAIQQSDIDNLESTFLEQVRKSLRDSLQVDVDVVGGLADGTMTLAGPATTDGGAPIVLEARASFVKPLSGAPAPSGGAAVALYTHTQSFALPRVQGLATEYTVILPEGLAVTDVKVTGGESTTSKSEDGRDQFTVTPEGDSAVATASLAVTPAFVFAKFTLVIVGAVLLLILLVGTPIALVVRKRRKA